MPCIPRCRRSRAGKAACRTRNRWCPMQKSFADRDGAPGCWQSGNPEGDGGRGQSAGCQNTLVETLVQYRRARLEKELVEGLALKNRGLDLTKEDLQFGTKRLLKRGSFTPGRLGRDDETVAVVFTWKLIKPRFPDDRIPTRWTELVQSAAANKQAEAATPAASVPPVR